MKTTRNALQTTIFIFKGGNGGEQKRKVRGRTGGKINIKRVVDKVKM